MKNKVIIICAFVITFSSAYSQIKKGNVQIGGSIGYSRNTQDQSSPNQISSSINSSWSVLPNFGYFVTKTSSLGLGLGYDRFDQHWKISDPDIVVIGQPRTLQTSENESSRNLFIIKPYYRLHKIVSESFVLFAEFNAFYGFGKREQTGNSVATEIDANGAILSSQTTSSSQFNEEQNTWGVGLNPGIIFFPAKHWGVELNVGLLGYAEVIGEQPSSSSNLILQPSLNNLSIGLKYYIVK